ncbi:hypothetical protein PC128_g7653 [Phytophthora cactorum]|nr:hypothetical protein PC121_g7715 [Phytophthora cactorum]KAG3196390.1 hypothetical protein PC128_g7653 [Phytophthora cactorum]KAG4058267.1 hypothetical protein PC123_g6734 [Phytophthora cactorum]
MSGMHRFKSIYEDDSCSEAPTGVFVKRLNDCKNQVASDGTVCEALYNDDDNLIGYVEDSCYDGRGAGFDALFDGESYMAYDYFYGGDCTDYENSAAYRASGDCETLIDDDSPARSATISVTSSGLVWTRNMGPTATSLGCPGEGAPGYYEFDVPSSDINTGACKNFKDIGGGFSFYDTSNVTTPTETPAPKPVSTAPASTPSSASSSTTPSTNSATASSTSSGTVTSGNQGNSSSTTGSTLSPTTDLSGSSSSSP